MRTPESAAQSDFTVSGITLELHLLVDGRRVIAKPGMDAFFAKMQAGALTTEEVGAVAAWCNSALRN